MNINRDFPGSRCEAAKRHAVSYSKLARSGRLPRGLTLINVGALLCWASHAWADDVKTAYVDPVVNAVKATELTAQADEVRELKEKYARLAPRGFNLGLPGPADTIDPQAFGLRSALADHGIGWFGMNLFNVAKNVLPDSARSFKGKQQYNGQQFTWSEGLYLVLLCHKFSLTSQQHGQRGSLLVISRAMSNRSVEIESGTCRWTRWAAARDVTFG